MRQSVPNIARMVRRQAGWTILFFVVLHVAPLQAAQEVTISGGADPSGHNYEWVVTNRSTTRIVAIDFPHVHADLCLAPDGWTTQGSTGLVGQDAETHSGICHARANSPAKGIAAGQSLTFRIRIAPIGAARGTGSVIVTLADERRVEVAGVELPKSPEGQRNYVMLFGMGAILAIWIVFDLWRKRKRLATES